MQLQMNATLAAVVDSCTLMRCLDSHRFDTFPLILNGACFSFADQFLKVANKYGVSVLLNSTAEFNCCIQVQTNTLSAEQGAKLRKSLDGMVSRSAVAETERQVYPMAFAMVKEHVESKDKSRSETDKKEIGALYGGKDWVCPYRDALGTLMGATKGTLVRSTLDASTHVNLWISSANRLGLIAHLINREPGLDEFLSQNGTRMELPMMVFEFLCVVDPIAYRRDSGDLALSLAFQSRDFANGGFYAGLPYRASANHRFILACEGKQTHQPEDTVFKPVGAMTALFVLFAHTARMRHVDIRHMDGFMHSCMSYTMSVIHRMNQESKRCRTAVLPVMSGSEVKLGWKLVRQCNKLADDDIQRVVPLALDSFGGTIPDVPGNVSEAIKRGFCRQLIDPDSKPSGPLKWRESKFMVMGAADAEKYMANHAHYDGIVKLRDWVKQQKESAATCVADHDELVKKLAYENKTTLASMIRKRGPRSPSRIVCIEIKNMNAANCVSCIERVLWYGAEFFAVEYFSKEESHYNTLIITRACDWNAFQTYTCLEVFSPSQTDKNTQEGISVTRFPQASSVFQLISSGAPSQLRVAFWILGKWYGLNMRDYPRMLDTTNFNKVAACMRIWAGNPDVIQLLVVGDLLAVAPRERMELMNMILEDPNDARIGLSLRSISKHINESTVTGQDPGRYNGFDMQMKLGRARSKAHSFNTTFEPGCNSTGIGKALMVALAAREAFYCGCQVSHLSMSPQDMPLCGMDASHVCTSLYDFPVAMQIGKRSTTIVHTDTCVFIERREYDEDLDKSDMYRWFEKLHAESIPMANLQGGNKIRQVQLRRAPMQDITSRKRHATTVIHVSKSPTKKKRDEPALEYEPADEYSPTRE